MSSIEWIIYKILYALSSNIEYTGLAYTSSCIAFLRPVYSILGGKASIIISYIYMFFVWWEFIGFFMIKISHELFLRVSIDNKSALIVSRNGLAPNMGWFTHCKEASPGPNAITATLLERHHVSNHRQFECLLNNFFNRTTKHQRFALFVLCTGKYTGDRWSPLTKSK